MLRWSAIRTCAKACKKRCLGKLVSLVSPYSACQERHAAVAYDARQPSCNCLGVPWLANVNHNPDTLILINQRKVGEPGDRRRLVRDRFCKLQAFRCPQSAIDD